MSPLLVMDDVCIVGAGLAVPPWCSSKNENRLAPKEKEDKKVLCGQKKRNGGTHCFPFRTHHSWITPETHWTLRGEEGDTG